MDTCENGEIYNMIIRGGNEGGLDGIDIWGANIHVHDVEVTNKDECVTVKVWILWSFLRTKLTLPTESCKEHSRRERILQLEWRMRHWFSRC